MGMFWRCMIAAIFGWCLGVLSRYVTDWLNDLREKRGRTSQSE